MTLSKERVGQLLWASDTEVRDLARDWLALYEREELLRKALEPFAAAYDLYAGGVSLEIDGRKYEPKLSDLRAARAALTESPEGKDKV